jgi:hypothetical protein
MAAFIPPKHCLEDDPQGNFKPFKDEVFTTARNLCTDIHTTGMLFSVLNEDEWNAQAAHQIIDINGAVQILPRPALTPKPAAPAPGDGANARAQKAHLQRQHSEEQNALNLLRQFLMAAIGPTIAGILGDTVTVRNMPLVDILARVFELYGEPDSATLEAWTDQLALQHTSSGTITKTCARHVKIHTFFDNAGQPMSDFSKMKALKATFSSYPAITESITDYEKENPAIADRTCNALVNHLIRQQSRITTGAAGFTANAAVSRSDVQQMIAEATTKAYNAGLADGAGRNAGGGRGTGGRGRGGAGGGRGGAGRGGAGRGAPAGAPRNYCYLHGYDGHAGARCIGMFADATGSYTPAMKNAVTHTAVPGGSTRNL